jgi:peptidoglycan/xylan/chitin deacetylase (PgdA/CDA1 family)
MRIIGGMSDILVLCYHAVSDRWPADLAVTPEQLENQLRYLVRRGYRGATFTEALTRPAKGRVLVVTFDDAFRSVLELAFPVLCRLGLSGTVFVPTAFAGSKQPMSWSGIDHWTSGPHASELIPLSWDELRELAAEGWEVGSHSRTHPKLTQLDDGELDRELRDSKDECEQRLGCHCTSFAYPYGDLDGRVVAAVGGAGYRVGAALDVRLHRGLWLEWPRFAVTREDSLARFQRQVSPVVRRVRASRAGPIVDGVYVSLIGALRRRRR